MTLCRPDGASVTRVYANDLLNGWRDLYSMTDIPFLAGGGRATELIQAVNWAMHPLGLPATWPEGLKTALSLVVNSPESMILCWGEEDLWFFFNETYIPLLGPRVDWAMGAKFDRVWADALDQAMPIVRDAFAGNSLRFIDLPWKLDTDRGVADTWWSFSYSRILDAEGKIAGLFIFTNETTKRYLADKALLEAQASLVREVETQRRSLQQMPGFAAILRGPDHIFDYVNDAYLRVSGTRDFIGRSVRDVFPDISGQGFYELLDRVYATGEPYVARALPIVMERENGKRFVDLVYAPILGDDGAVTGIFAGGYDVTEGVRAAADLAEANASLEQRVNETVGELMAAEEALRQAQKMDAVGQLTGGLAHDFNNLLAGISGSLELMDARIKQGRLADVDRYMVAAQGATRRAAALTHRLLAFSRRQALDPRATDINQLVIGMEDLIRRSVGVDIEIETAGAPGLWTTLVDPPQLENALLNLCINARDAMPSGGRITIETANTWIDEAAARTHDLPTGQYISLCVTDTGAGMSPAVVAKAFDPFFTTKPLGEGTGLGLSMVYGFAKQSGGQVRIYSEVAKGTTVCIYLPRHDGVAEAPTAVAGADLKPQAREGETVLIVDDEPTVRKLVTEVLEDLGYIAIEAADSVAGLKVLQSNARIDLLVTDVGLPGGMNGRQMAEAGRQARPGLQVLFITGYAENALIGNRQLEPGMAVMTKPFAIEALASRIREMISGA